MTKYKVFTTDENDQNPSFIMEYEDTAPRGASKMNARFAFGNPRAYHLPVPAGKDSRNYAISTRQSGVYEDVEYIADNEGQGAITLEFDGVKDIATVVSEWNAANVGNEVSHDAADDSVVPGFGTLALAGDGAYHLVRDPASIAAAVTQDKSAQITQKYQEMVADVLADMAVTFGTTDPDSANAHVQTWEKMKANPAAYSTSGLTAWVATSGFAVGDALDDNTKVTNFANECILAAETYAVNRLVRIQQFRNERDAILAS